MQSPRFQAILRVTSGRKKKAPDVKSFSHELNSKGVRPFPLWKSRAFSHKEVNCFFFIEVEQENLKEKEKKTEQTTSYLTRVIFTTIFVPHNGFKVSKKLKSFCTTAGELYVKVF